MLMPPVRTTYTHSCSPCTDNWVGGRRIETAPYRAMRSCPGQAFVLSRPCFNVILVPEFAWIFSKLGVMKHAQLSHGIGGHNGFPLRPCGQMLRYRLAAEEGRFNSRCMQPVLLRKHEILRIEDDFPLSGVGGGEEARGPS